MDAGGTGGRTHVGASGTRGKSSIWLRVGGGVYIQVGLCRANLIILQLLSFRRSPKAPSIDWQGARDKKGGVPVDLVGAGSALLLGETSTGHRSPAREPRSSQEQFVRELLANSLRT